ncbi:MAG: hypothetical protein IMY84_02630 [Chloroflexi bacterium]|nr:hypothetical protein [Chloroflexota bacterium]
MRGGLWLVRLFLLCAASFVVFSPLVVRGEAALPGPTRWQYDASGLMLPSSSVYPAVSAYRQVRMELTEGNPNKAELSLMFANEDAAAIGALVRRQEYVDAVNHGGTFQEDFDRCVGWILIARERGTDVSSLLARLKNDHLGQQVVLGEAVTQLPEWAFEGLTSTREHVAEVLVEAIGMLEGWESAEAYLRMLSNVDADLGSRVTVEGPVEAEAETPPLPPAASPEMEPDIVDIPADPPVIVDISIDRDDVDVGDKCTVSCEVEADDEAALDYSWACSEGKLSMKGNTATWTAPDEPGRYRIEVTVTDSLGQSDGEYIEVRVRESEEDAEPDPDPDPDPGPGSSAPPEIVEISVTAEHKYLEKSMVGYSILVGRSCEITCEVADDDGVSYEWVATAGEITGSGDTITWSAPHAPYNEEVTVTVSNSSGEQDSMTLCFHVTTCTQCF